jgi:hypothetical protein
MNLETPPVELFVDKSTKKRIKNEWMNGSKMNEWMDQKWMNGSKMNCAGLVV